MTIRDERLKARTLRAITLQQAGHFVLDHRQELPLPVLDLRYSRLYDYETSWGGFRFDPEARSLLVLCQGQPPDELLPQPRLRLATAILHAGYASIQLEGSAFELDFQTRDRVDYESLRLLNRTLADEGLPVVVWQLEPEKGEMPPVIRLANDSAMLFASSAIWDNENQQLVASQVISTSQDLLKAIKATLANNNSKSFLTLKTPDESAYLKGARRGYLAVTSSLAQANAEGTVTTLLHPLSGDPQAGSNGCYYLVVAPGECLERRFVERLDLAIPWPLQSDWAAYLLAAGQAAGLVEALPQCGDDFSAGLRIARNEAGWQQVIAAGLEQGQIHISQTGVTP